MISRSSPSVADWKEYLLIGEELLNQTSAAAQCRLILEKIKNSLQVEVQIWLAKPFYPLPGETESVLLLLNDPAPETVLLASRTKEIEAEHLETSFFAESKSDSGFGAVAVPMKTQNHLLGVLYAEKSGNAFSQAEIDFLDGVTAYAALAFQAARQLLLKNWRAEQLMLVQSVSEQIANLLDLDELCKRVTYLIQKSFNYYYVAIYTINQDQEMLELRSCAYPLSPADSVSHFSVNKGQGIVGYVAEKGVEILAPDVARETHYRHIDSLPETRSETALPLKVENKILGVLDIQSDKPNNFHDIDMMVLRALANNTALAIESAYLYQSMNQRAEQIATIVDINHILNSILDLDILIEKVIQLIQERLNYPFVHIYTIHPVRRKIIYGTGAGLRSEAMRSREITYDLDDPEGMIPWVARNGKTILANDVNQEPLYRVSDLPPANTWSELTVPVKFVDEVLGVLDIQSDQKNAFSENDISLIEALASSVAISIRNAMLFSSEKWRVQVADSFREVSTLISANLPLEDILDSILSKLENNLPCDVSAIWLLERPFEGAINEEKTLRLAAAHGVESQKIINTFDDLSVRKMIESVLSVENPNIREAGDPVGPLGAALDFPCDYSSIAAPLLAGGKPLGILALAHNTSGRYGKEARDMTATFASYAAVAIQNARLFEDLQEQAWVSTVLLQVSEATQSITTTEELLSTMVRLPSLLIGIKLCAIFLWEESLNALELKNWYGLKQHPQKTLFEENESASLKQMFDDHNIIDIKDIASEFGLIPDGLNVDSARYVLLPMLNKNNLVGCFLFGYTYKSDRGQELSFIQQILAILQGITHQATMALENLRLEEAQEEEAYVTAVLLEVAQAVVSQNDLDDILETIVHILPILVGIDTSVIYLWDKDKEIFQPAQAFATSDEDEIFLLSHSYKPGDFHLLDNILQTNGVHFCVSQISNIPISKWAAMTSFSENSLTHENVHVGDNLLIGFPLSVKGETLGILVARESVTTLAFQARRLEIITGIARQLSLAIQNEQYKLDMVESERMEQEIKLARQSQQTFLPSQLPSFNGWDLFADWEPAREVGGDFYDMIELDRDHLGLVIADVSDKGMPAALYMTVTRTLIRAYAQSDRSPASVLEKVNELLIPDTQNGMFVTAIYAVLTRKSGKLTYSIAGHNPPVILDVSRNQSIQLLKGGIALGVLEDIQLEDREIVLSPGDTILFYTDGITEAFNEKGETFGEERLLLNLDALMLNDAKSTLESLQNILTEFRGSAPVSDDATMLCVKRKPTKSG